MQDEIIRAQLILKPITVEEMCASLPSVFILGAKPRPPLQTLEQWARAQ